MTHNEQRIEQASKALDHYKEGRSHDEALIDILTDLQHWAAAYGEDFDTRLKTARMHYDEEQGDG